MGPKKAKTNNKKKQVTQPDEHVPNEEKYMRGKTTGYKVYIQKGQIKKKKRTKKLTHTYFFF
jgi:hypothetical protein